MLPLWDVKHPGHSAQSAGGRLLLPVRAVYVCKRVRGCMLYTYLALYLLCHFMFYLFTFGCSATQLFLWCISDIKSLRYCYDTMYIHHRRCLSVVINSDEALVIMSVLSPQLSLSLWRCRAGRVVQELRCPLCGRSSLWYHWYMPWVLCTSCRVGGKGEGG